MSIGQRTMIILPKEKPILDRLNSYYLKLPKLLEHFQGAVGCGLVHFKAATAEGLVIFDKDEILNGVFQEKDEVHTGSNAVSLLMHIDENASFAVAIFGVKPEEIDYWSTMPNGRRIYQNLSTEFTDLEALIKKMGNEELTGIIDVAIGDGKEGGLLLLNAGRVVGGSYSWRRYTDATLQEDQELLVQKTKLHGGTFHVSRLPSKGEHVASVPSARPAAAGPISGRTRNALEELLGILERLLEGRKGMSSSGFHTTLNRKFVEKADEFSFLDPFAGEFKYAGRKIAVIPEVSDKELWQGVTESVAELSDDLGLKQALQENLVAWKKKYQKELAHFGVRF